jgi:hypothetical protein
MSQTINVFKKLRQRIPQGHSPIMKCSNIMEYPNNGISKMFFCLVLASWTSNLTWNFSHKYDGANPFKHLKAKMASLNFNMYLTGRQPSWCRTGSHVIVFSCSCNNTCSKVLNCLKLFNISLGCIRPNSRAVIHFTKNQGVYNKN